MWEKKKKKIKKERHVKLVGSRKLESGVDKGDVRERDGERKKKKKTNVKHEHGVVIILNFEFE